MGQVIYMDKCATLITYDQAYTLNELKNEVYAISKELDVNVGPDIARMTIDSFSNNGLVETYNDLCGYVAWHKMIADMLEIAYTGR